MILSAPTQAVFYFALVLGVLALLSELKVIDLLPSFWLAFSAFIVLLIGCMMKGI